MKNQNEFTTLFEKLVKFATLRPRSQKEITDYFQRKRVSSETQILLLAKLKSFGFVDDVDFTRWWVDQRLAFRQTGEKLLKNELRLKGISDETILSVFKEKDIVKDQKKIANEFMSKKINRYKQLPKNEFRKKVYGLLLRNGFDWDIAK